MILAKVSMTKPTTFYLKSFDMRLYIDKENIISFMANRDNDLDLFDESVRLIKRGMEVYYNFPKSEIQNSPVLMAWFGRMKGSGVKYASIFCPDATVKPERPVKANFYTNYDSSDRGAIFLLNIEENTYNIINDKRSILISRPGGEMSIFKTLLEIPERPEMMTDISSWKDYCPEVPLTDVIISDNHYFKNRFVYEKNDNELIRALASIPKDTFNVVIVTKDGQVDMNINLENEYKKIKDIIASTTGLSKKKCSVTIITTNRTHSRHIITNYYRVSPTTCVHLKDNGLKEDADISIHPHTDPNAVKATKRLVSIFKSIAANPVKIIGDKKSNFISFT